MMSNNGIWKQRDLETKGFGNKGIWKQRDLETKGFGNKGIWKPRAGFFGGTFV